MTGTDRLEFWSIDGRTEVRTGQGARCVFVSIDSPQGVASVVLKDDEAEALGRSLIRRARYSRERVA